MVEEHRIHKLTQKPRRTGFVRSSRKSLHLAGRLIASTAGLFGRVPAGTGVFLSFVSGFSIHSAAFNIVDMIKFHFPAFLPSVRPHA